MDYLHDFYFAIFSDVRIFGDLDREFVLSWFDLDSKYKRNVMKVAFFVKSC